jgi:methylated-DNA-[protein]-cysteine S-methyltransferase
MLTNDSMTPKMKFIRHYDSPLGGITIASDGEALTGLWFDGQKYFPDGLADGSDEIQLPVFDLTQRWLDIYFSGQQPDFTPPLKLKTTAFRKDVCEIMRTIPFGETMTYGEIATRIAAQKGIRQMSAQAVGGAVAHNPISLIIPCHRVVGSNGSMTGYAGGLDRKVWLLEMEHSVSKGVV